MTPVGCLDQAPTPSPRYQRALATSLHLDALTLVTRLELLALCWLAVPLAHRQCPPPPAARLVPSPGVRRASRDYTEETLVLLALLRTL